MWRKEDGQEERKIELQRRREILLNRQLIAIRAAERAAERERQLAAQQQAGAQRPEPIGEDGLPAVAPDASAEPASLPAGTGGAEPTSPGQDRKRR